MSYLVLARKWRPQGLEEVVGQGHVTQTLQNALRNDRLAHALLFSGARGVGKTSVARILAKALSCVDGPTPSPCNRCPICQEITAGTAVDVQEIDGASNRGIDEIRQLRENIRFQPSLCRYRVYIIDEVHMLTKEAFNALLKTLEEPPAHVYFIFATTEPQKIPATIHSRCQHFEFRRLNTSEILEHLRRIVKAEGLGLDDEALALLAREADGSVRDSLSLLDQVAAYGASGRREVCEALGLVDTLVLRRLAEAILSRDVASGLALIDEIYRFAGDIEGLAADLVLLFRNLLVLRTMGPGRATGLVDLTEEEMKDLEGLAAAHTPQTLSQLCATLISGQEDIHRSSTPKLSFEILLIRLCQLGEVAGLDTILGKIDELLSGINPMGRGGPVSRTAVPSTEGYEKERGASVGREGGATGEGAIPSPTSEDPMDLAEPVTPFGSAALRDLTRETWEAFVHFVEGQWPPLATLVRDCTEPRIEDGVGVQLLCRHGVQHDLLSDRANQQRLAELARGFFGREITITVEENDRADAAQSSGPGACHRRQDLVQSPLVQEALRVFKGRITEVRVFDDKDGGRVRPQGRDANAPAQQEPAVRGAR